jgi:hypothetical protein
MWADIGEDVLRHACHVSMYSYHDFFSGFWQTTWTDIVSSPSIRNISPYRECVKSWIIFIPKIRNLVWFCLAHRVTFHAQRQGLVLMTDPAVPYLPNDDYGPFNRGTELDIWLKAANKSAPSLSVVWPGVTVYPDWFHASVQE